MTGFGWFLWIVGGILVLTLLMIVKKLSAPSEDSENSSLRAKALVVVPGLHGTAMSAKRAGS